MYLILTGLAWNEVICDWKSNVPSCTQKNDKRETNREKNFDKRADLTLANSDAVSNERPLSQPAQQKIQDNIGSFYWSHNISNWDSRLGFESGGGGGRRSEEKEEE